MDVNHTPDKPKQSQDLGTSTSAFNEHENCLSEILVRYLLRLGNLTAWTTVRAEDGLVGGCTRHTGLLVTLYI
eukprot:2187610-Amphidinium_carterae.1